MILLLSESEVIGRTEGTTVAAMAELKEPSPLICSSIFLPLQLNGHPFLLVVLCTAADDTRKAKGMKRRVEESAVRYPNSVPPLLSFNFLLPSS